MIAAPHGFCAVCGKPYVDASLVCRCGSLTSAQRQELIHRYYPIRTVYTGKIWGGVQVNDTFMREKAEDILLSGYDGLYSELMDDLDTLVLDTPFDEMFMVSAGVDN